MDYGREASASAAARLLLARSTSSSEINGEPTFATRRELFSAHMESIRLQISSRKKAFIFIVVVDFLVTLLLWLLLADSEDLLDDMLSVHVLLKYQTSLFDFVIVSFARVLVLITWYWVLNWKSRLGVMFTTVSCTLIFIIKCFYYKFGQSKDEYLEYFLVFISLILVWTEFGFYEIRILPAYRKLELMNLPSERRPILRRRPRSYVSDTLSRGSGTSNYHTPQYLTPRSGSPVSGQTPPSALRHPSSDEESFVSREDASSMGERLYIQMGHQTAQFCIEMAHDTTQQWKIEKKADEGRIVCDSLERPNQNKLFRCKGILMCLPDVIFQILYTGIEQQQEWNSTVLKCEVLHQIDSQTDIIYNIASEAAGGVVSRRDFVNVRCWEKRGNVYISSATGVEYDLMPAQEGIIRGYNGPGGYVFAPDPENPAHTQLIWLLDTDLKGWIPKYIIDKALTGVMVTFFSSLAARVERLQQEVL